jgi:hypothetical protein
MSLIKDINIDLLGWIKYYSNLYLNKEKLNQSAYVLKIFNIKFLVLYFNYFLINKNIIIKNIKIRDYDTLLITKGVINLTIFFK